MDFKRIMIVMIVLSALWLVGFTNAFSKDDRVFDRKSGEGTMAFEGTETDSKDAETNYASIERYDPIVVLELFTSQGCSSCPPADALLDKVKKEFDETVFALSYHVDYWNYIGWDDSFSSPEFTKKQRNYNIKMRNNTNYTPELVVNGKEHLVGSSVQKVYSAIQKYSAMEASNKLVLSKVNSDGKAVSFNYEVLGDLTDKNLRAVLVIDERTTEVRRGENRNSSLTNSNIVVNEKWISMDANSNSFVAIPEIVRPGEKLSLILLAENSVHDITGAVKALVP